MTGEPHDEPGSRLDAPDGGRPPAMRPRDTRRRPPSRRRYRRRRALALLGLVVVLFGAWFLIELFQPFAGPGTGIIEVPIPSGYSAASPLFFQAFLD